MKLDKLPRWVVSEEESVWRETADSRRMTPDERLAMMAALCSAGAKLLSMNDRRDYVLKSRDPLPASTVEALSRLRKQRSRSP
jgi:hypothetical protein